MRAVNPRRRRLLAGATAALALACALPRAARPATSQARPPQRIVVLNWELTETLLALGGAPIGIPLPDWYTNTIVMPPLPPGVVDVGLLYQPNFDVLLALAPDLLIVTPAHAGLLGPLQRIAPTLTLGEYMTDAHPFERLCGETQTLARALGALTRAADLIAQTQRTVAGVAARLQATPARATRPVIVADAIDERHLRVYAAGSLFDEMLRRIGVVNAANHERADRAARWATDEMGSATVPLQRLLDVAHANILLVGPLQADVRAALTSSPLWRALPAARERRVAVLPVIEPYGGLVSMQRFAVAAAAALATIANGGGGLG